MITLTPKKWLVLAAIVVAIAGLFDSVYLTIHHYTAEPVPCSITEGCEMVLTSAYAEVAGLPLAIFGAGAYLFALIFATMALFGRRGMWLLYGLLATMMALFSAWLIYVQAALIGAFCQFCLLSAASSTLLFVIFIVSVFSGRKPASTDDDAAAE
ncbi:MAG: Vitamin K epoxide reductase family protein [Acidobacteria bacterium OLB17]|nr:MAG: Vitamin K epoxide reductase family protein [Acidobacteria bacterium OLB17]MCZ2390275.1 vitamin K epoxide reductase family protein [Acidobacteriota bacterium]